MPLPISIDFRDPDAGTTTVDDEFLELVTIQGREFQKYSIEHNVQYSPVDDEEADRQSIQHQVFDRVFEQRLLFPPVADVKDVLDCGYGTGSWAIEVAENYPDCTVIGIDISPHMRFDDTPENFWPQLDDLNRRFTFPTNSFDLIHSRLVVGGINRGRWPSYLRDMFRVLRPGGWVQMVEFYYNCQSDNGSITEESALRQWSNQYLSALDDKKDPRAPLQLGTHLANAGFTSVESQMIPLPISGWSNDPREKATGEANKENIQQALRAHTLYLFTARLGMSTTAFEQLISRACEEAANPSTKAYFPLYVV
ncbi:hypothetical protein MMC09_000881 [Bachmanniomyces sp. S44760]|nr:hypothetical protein [Bachmanniomyces sp. S44760]